jgi:hypothetical protein
MEEPLAPSDAIIIHIIHISFPEKYLMSNVNNSTKTIGKYLSHVKSKANSTCIHIIYYTFFQLSPEKSKLHPEDIYRESIKCPDY